MYKYFIQFEKKYCRYKNNPDEIIGYFEDYIGKYIQRTDIVQFWDWITDFIVKPEYIRFGTIQQIVQYLKKSLFSIYQKEKYQNPKKIQQNTVLYSTILFCNRIRDGKKSISTDRKKKIVSVCQKLNNFRFIQNNRQKIVYTDSTILQ